MRRATSTLLLLLLGLCGCAMGRDAMYKRLATRAAFDLDCPVHELTITELDQANAGVSGCGRHATYIGVCQSFQCTWLQQGARAETAAEEAR